MSSRETVSAVLPFIVAATFFMEYLDTTVIATALPQMAHSHRPDARRIHYDLRILALGLLPQCALRNRGADCHCRMGSESARGGAAAVRPAWIRAVRGGSDLSAPCSSPLWGLGYARLARGAGSAIGGGAG